MAQTKEEKAAKQRERAASYGPDTRAKRALASRKWERENKEKVAAGRRRRWEADPVRAVADFARLSALHDRSRSNKGSNAARVAAYRASKDLATPAWADRAIIKKIYKWAEFLSDATGTRYEVDHIVPLRGLRVCGLHVPCNLRVITKQENMRKGNRIVEKIVGT